MGAAGGNTHQGIVCSPVARAARSLMRRLIASLVFLSCPATAFAASSLLLVLAKQDNTLEIVDPASGKILSRIPVGNDPHEVVASADGTRAYASNYGGPRSSYHTIAQVDLIARKALAPIDIAPLRGSHGLAWASGELYFTAEVNKVFGRWNPATGRVDWIMGTGQDRTHMIELSADLNDIYTGNINSNTVSLFHRVPGNQPFTDLWTQTLVPVGEGPEGFDVSPNGKELWAANSHGASVSIVDLATAKVTATIPVGTGQSNRLRFTPDGKHAFISDLRTGDLVILDAASRQIVKRLKLGRSAAGILMVPERNCAYVALSADNRLDVIDLSTLEVKGHIATGRGPDGMAWVHGR